jgi:orotate phosphoribosyltransferase
MLNKNDEVKYKDKKDKVEENDLRLLSLLYETKAFQCFENNQPFWYTSGKIGPYYINTHYLYGSKKSAEELLKDINNSLKNKQELIKFLNKSTYENYLNNNIYREIIGELLKKASLMEKEGEIDYISGGERRDWFFSFTLAKILKKKHITIFKDGTVIIFDGTAEEFIWADIKKQSGVVIEENCKILHVTDLVTEASSFETYWVPALKNKGAKIQSCLSVVDRLQGGSEKLKEFDIHLSSIFKIDKEFFESALVNNLINLNQFNLLISYIEKPEEAIENFLKSNPGFLLNALNSSDEKIAARAKIAIEKQFYKVI